jgi:hypothetical protein
LNELGEFFNVDAIFISNVQLESIYLVLAHLNEISEFAPDPIRNVNLFEREILSEKGSWQPLANVYS